jgi:hypothetical protein
VEIVQKLWMPGEICGRAVHNFRCTKGAVPSGLGSLFLGLPRTYTSASLRAGWGYCMPSPLGLGLGAGGLLLSLGMRRRTLCFGEESTGGGEVRILYLMQLARL